MSINVQEAYRTTNRLGQKDLSSYNNHYPEHTEQRISKAAKEKNQVIHKDKPLTPNFSMET